MVLYATDLTKPQLYGRYFKNTITLMTTQHQKNETTVSGEQLRNALGRKTQITWSGQRIFAANTAHGKLYIRRFMMPYP